MPASHTSCLVITPFNLVKAGAVFSAEKICPNPLLLIDAYYGGRGTIAGTVKEKATPSNVPLRRRVVLIDERSRIAIRETWSDAVTGAFEFRNLKQGMKYSTISYDHTNAYRAVIADNQEAL